MNVIVRWSIGPVKPEGFLCLEKSIEQIQKLYPNFKRIALHNQLNLLQVNKLQKINAKIIESNGNPINHLLPQKGYHVHWKLYPPRLDIESYEIFMDNDVILHEKLDQITEAITKSQFLLYEGRHGLYGEMEHFFKHSTNLNSGIFGIPPGYNFASKLEDASNWLVDWQNRFDEQGLVSYLLHNKPHQLITQKDVPIFESSETYFQSKGSHFVELNYGEHDHKAWMEYQEISTQKGTNDLQI